ncbi:hypothetical protein ISS37_04440 [candidate division KSB1 bacterium]|nr:hypothetical protein [candidate division KSB1 bacterium]
MKRNCKYWCIILILGLVGCFLVGCGATVRVNVLKPAVINVGPVKRLAVMDFDVPEGVDPSVGFGVAEKLTAKLVENGFYDVIERRKLEEILKEHKLSLSGVVDQFQAQDIGELVGADALVFGSVNTYSTTDGGGVKDFSYYSKKEKKKVVNKKYEMVRTANVTITFRVSDVRLGMVVASKSNTATARDRARENIDTSAEEETRKAGLLGVIVDAVLDKKKVSPEERAKRAATSKLVDPKFLLDKAADKILDSFVRQIAPHYVMEYRNVESGKHPMMKSGLEYAKRDMWPEAKEAWDEVLKTLEARKDHPVAHYNLGIYYEINGDLDRAEEEFTTAFKATGKKKYLDAKARIQRRKKEQEKLEEQLKEKGE